MTGMQMLQNVTREIPEGELGDFIATTNRCAFMLALRRDWNHYRTTLALPATETLTCTVTNASAVLTASTAYFTDDLVGQTVTIESDGDEYEAVVESVESATSLTLVDAWDELTDTDAVVVLPIRTDWRVPATFRKCTGLFSENGRYRYIDPVEYKLGLPISGRRPIEWTRNQPSGNLVLNFLRKYVPIDTLTDEIDIPDVALDCLFYTLCSHVTWKLDFETYKARNSNYRTQAENAYTMAASDDNTERDQKHVNRSTMYWPVR